MKTFAPVLTLAIGSLLLGQTALADDPIVANPLIAIPVDGTFVPVGYDDNDDVVVVLDGHLPNNCYRVSHTEVIRDQATTKISVVQYARKYPGVCIQSTVPFSSEVDLGVLPMGQFKIATPGVVDEPLAVKEATTAGPDEYLYAPIDATKINYDETTHKYTAILEGRFTNSCMRIKDVVVINSGKTIEVLPKMELAADQGACSDTEVPFSWRVELPDHLNAGRHLLHTRSLNGKAVNQMFSVY